MTMLVVGDVNADLIATLRQYPPEGGDTQIEHLSWNTGGSAANVAAVLAMLGVETRLLARVGRDANSQAALRRVGESGVLLDCIQYDEHTPTGTCYVLVSGAAERTFLSYRGANTMLALPDPPLPPTTTWLHIAGHALLEGQQRETALALLHHAHANGIPVSLDLCQPIVTHCRNIVLSVLPSLHMLFANQQEINALLPETNPRNRFDALAGTVGTAVGGGILVVKRGANGCSIRGSSYIDIAGIAVEPVDTTGCGDAFVAGFLAAHRAGCSPGQCAATANQLGAYTATLVGAIDAMTVDVVRAALPAPHP